MVGKYGEGHPAWKGDEVGYMAVHQRLRRGRGPAKSHQCIDCGKQAAHWSYDHSDPNPKIDEKNGPYSTDLDRYHPRCRPCHKIQDKNHSKVERNQVIRDMFLAGHSRQYLAELFGLHPVYINQIARS